jgi:hypothetical protein
MSTALELIVKAKLIAAFAVNSHLGKGTITQF